MGGAHAASLAGRREMIHAALLRDDRGIEQPQ